MMLSASSAVPPEAIEPTPAAIVASTSAPAHASSPRRAVTASASNNPISITSPNPNDLGALPSVIQAGVVNPANGHTYYLLSSSDWTNSEAEAVQLGGHLATVRSAAENQWIEQNFAVFNLVWLGFAQVTGVQGYSWTDGEPITYTNWYPGHPTTNLPVAMYPQGTGALSGCWVDFPNISGYAFGLVEVPTSVPQITWAPPPAITYGTALSAAQLDATTTVAGSFVYSPPLGTVLGAGTPTLSVTFTPTDTTHYTTATTSVQLVVNRATPTITWATPAAIAYGTPLTIQQLNATAKTPGTFAYSPAPGSTPPGLGAQTLSVTFSPVDTTNYSATTTSVQILVTQTAFPSVSRPGVLNPANGHTYYYLTASTWFDAEAKAEQLGGHLVTIRSAADNTWISQTFGASDLWIGYRSVTGWVDGEPTTYTNWYPGKGENPSPGVPAAMLAAAYGGGAGYWLEQGFQYIIAHGLVERSQPLFAPAPQLTWPTPSAIAYGTPLSSTQLNAAANGFGTFSYDPPAGQILAVGTRTLSVNYVSEIGVSATASVQLTVNQSVPAMAWGPPSSIQYGTPLSGAQLNATTNVAGSFIYSPAAGTALGVGTQNLDVTFMPADSQDYAIATSSVQLIVNPSTPLPTAIGGRIFNAANGHSYQLLTSSDWINSEAAAEQLGGHLATIRSADEATWIEQNFASAGPLWIGYSDANATGGFAWADGESPTYDNWLPSEPNGQQYTIMQPIGLGGYDGGWKAAPDNSPGIFGLVEFGQAISASAATVSTVLVNGYTEPTASVSVNLDLTEPDDSDLTAVLTSPRGTTIVLFSNVGADGSNFRNTSFADSAGLPIQSAAAPFTGAFKPTQSLSSLVGGTPNGSWQLTITCLAGASDGILNHWSLSFQPIADAAQNQFIPNGFATPSVENGTDFGSTAGTVTHEFDVTNNGAEIWGGGQPVVTYPDFPQKPVSGQITSQILISGASSSLTSLSVSFSSIGQGITSPTLTSPSGTQVTLFNRPLWSIDGNLFPNITFSDAGVPLPTLNPLVLPLVGTFAPQTPLSTFAGQNPNGIWTFTLGAGLLNAQLLHWSLNITGASSLPSAIVTGTNAGDFTVTRQPTLPPALGGSYRPFDVSFKPTGPGLRYAWITVANIDGNGTDYKFEVKGEGVAAPILIVSRGFDDLSFSITNGGLAPLNLNGISIVNVTWTPLLPVTPVDLPSELTVMPPAITCLAPGQSTSLQVINRGSELGSAQGILRILTNDPADLVFIVSVDTVIDIGRWPDPNSGAAGTSLAVGNAVQLDQQSAGGSTVNGSTGSTASPADFGSAAQGATPATFDFTVTDSGTSAVAFGVLPRTTGNFSVVQSGFTSLSPGQSTKFTVGMMSSSVGPQTGTCFFAIIGTDFTEQDFYYNLTGQIIVPVGPKIGLASGSTFVKNTGATPVTPPPGSLTDFGQQRVGTASSLLTFSVNSVGSNSLQLTPVPVVTISDATDFSISQPTTMALNVGSSTSFTVAFVPTKVGSLTAVVTVRSSDATQSSYSFTVCGTGVPPASPITWSAPAAITFGTPLSAVQLDASSTIPGSFVYAPALGALLGAGTRTLSVTFTPTDMVNYMIVTTTVGLVVNRAIPVITWPSPGSILFGATLSSAQLNASANTAGTFIYTPAAGFKPSIGTQTLTASFTPTDSADYTSATASMQLVVRLSGTSAVVSRFMFYNNSSFDGNSTAANASDDAAIALNPDGSPKTALLPGQTASFANYTSYNKGINGIMIDVAGLPTGASLTLADFTFSELVRSGASIVTAAAPSASPLLVRRSAGIGGSDRIEVTWPDGSIVSRWLQITVLANSHTGLTAPDIFYFGNAPGESGNSSADAAVNVADVLGTRGRASITSVGRANAWDYNRDGFITVADMLIARGNTTASATSLPLLNAPASVGAALPAAIPDDAIPAASLLMQMSSSESAISAHEVLADSSGSVRASTVPADPFGVIDTSATVESIAQKASSKDMENPEVSRPPQFDAMGRAWWRNDDSSISKFWAIARESTFTVQPDRTASGLVAASRISGQIAHRHWRRAWFVSRPRPAGALLQGSLIESEMPHVIAQRTA